jgi:hypothetical protein
MRKSWFIFLAVVGLVFFSKTNVFADNPGPCNLTEPGPNREVCTGQDTADGGLVYRCQHLSPVSFQGRLVCADQFHSYAYEIGDPNNSCADGQVAESPSGSRLCACNGGRVVDEVSGTCDAAAPTLVSCTEGQAVGTAANPRCICNGEGLRVTNGRCVGQTTEGENDTDTQNQNQTPSGPLTNEDFDLFNPLKQFGDADTSEQLSTPGGIVSRVLVFAFPIAGMILFVMLVWSGFEILAGSASKKSLDAGKQRATAAIIGFVLLFASYWIAQILEVVFGINIL